MCKLTDVRRDIVHTIRQVVDVVSKYAGGALPEPARGRVRGFILKLPQRWASKVSSGPAGSGVAGAGGLGLGEREREIVAAAGTGTGALRQPGGQRRAAQWERGTGSGTDGGVRLGPSSRATSPSASPCVARAVVGNGGASSGADGSGNAVSVSTALVASQRILVLAMESLDMMRNVMGVVKESLDRADAYVLSLFQKFFFFFR